MDRKIFAFLKKDFLNETSYRLGFVLNIFSVLAGILGYYYIDRLFGAKITPHLEEFGVSYFSYVLLGMAFFSYAGAGLGSFSSRIYSEQVEGTLETILLTPTKISTLLLSLGLWNLLLATMDLALYILFGVFLFKINFASANLLSTAVILLLTIASFSALGILSASFILIFKRGNPVSWIVSTLEGLIGGVYFPVTVLPAWLQFLAKLMPITYAIRSLELAVYRGYPLTALRREIGFLAAFSLLLLPLSLAAFKHALRRSRKNATLSEY